MDANESNLAESNDGSSRHSKDSHHGRSRSHWGLSTAVHGVGFVAKKMVNNRLTDSLWSSKKSSSSSSAHVSSDTASDQTNKPSLNVADEQTTKSTVSVKPTHERQKKGKDVLDQSENSNSKSKPRTKTSVVEDSENSKPQDGSDSTTTSSNVNDQPETPKHKDASHVRVVNQHRWPSTTTSNIVDHSGASKLPSSPRVKPVNQHRWPSTTSSSVIDNSENSKPPDGKPVTQNLWPSTVGSSVLSKNVNPPEEVSKTCMIPDRRMLQESLNDPTTESQPSTPKKSHGLASRGVSPSPAARGASLIPSSKGVRGVSLTPAKGVSLTPATRGVSLTPASRRVDPPSVTRDIGVDPLITRGIVPSVATRELSPTVATKGPNLIPPGRGASPVPTTRPVNPLPGYHTPLQPSSPTKSFDTNTEEPDLTPTREASPSPSPPDRPTSPTQSTTTTRGVSPTPTKHSDLSEIGRRVISRAKSVAPIPSKPAGGVRHFFSSNILSMLTTNRKEKIVAERKDASQYLELLHTIQVQWQFLNADTEAAMDLQRVTAEKSLFDMLKTILELRDSIAAKKIDITLSILQLKIYAILYRQMSYIDDWGSIEKEHESALSVTVNDLVTRSILLPIIGGVNVKVDIKLLKFVIYSSVQVMQATMSSIESTLAKVGGTRHLASELVNVALHERALLDECEIFLSSAAPLQIEECSLRGHLIQLNRTYNSE